MRLKENYVLRQVADTWVVLPIGDAAVDMDGMLTLNESGALLWKQLENGADQARLLDVMCDEYRVDREQAKIDIEDYLQVLRQAGCLEH